MQLEEIGKNRHLISYKIKGNYVILFTENEKIKILESTFSNFNLVIGQEIKQDLLKEIAFYDRKEEIKLYIESILNKRPYNVKQIYTKASAKFNSPKEVKVAIKELKEFRILDDKEYVDNYLDYFNKNNFGKYYIINFFIEQGVNRRVIDKIEFSDENEKNKAFNYFNSVKNKYVSNNFTKQKKKIYDSMIVRGFDAEVIIDLLSSLELDKDKERKNLLKDYKKAKAKLSNQYVGPMLVSRVVNRLINLGYELSMIKETIESEEEHLDD